MKIQGPHDPSLFLIAQQPVRGQHKRNERRRRVRTKETREKEYFSLKEKRSKRQQVFIHLLIVQKNLFDVMKKKINFSFFTSFIVHFI